MYMQGIPAEIQTPMHGNLIGYSMTTLLAVSSPRNILPPSQYALIHRRKN